MDPSRSAESTRSSYPTERNKEEDRSNVSKKRNPSPVPPEKVI